MSFINNITQVVARLERRVIQILPVVGCIIGLERGQDFVIVATTITKTKGLIIVSVLKLTVPFGNGLAEEVVLIFL